VRQQQTLYRVYLVDVFFGIISCLFLFAIGYIVYRQTTFVESVKPDYALLDKDSDTYWTDRILVDITTAEQSIGTKEQRRHRLRTFVYRTVEEAMNISSSYDRAQAVTSVAMVLAQHDIDFVLDNHLQKLGETSMVVSFRARALISQALMYLRLERAPAAQVALQRYNRLVIESDIKLNSPINEESFFGAVAVLHCLHNREGLKELFDSQRTSTAALGIDLRAKGYRLIVGEQVRTGMIADAMETAKRIDNHIEQARAWTLILQYAARPIPARPIEPTMLDLLDNPQTVPLSYPASAEQAIDDFFQYIAQKDANFQTSLLQLIAGSRLMCDVELYKIFRNRLVENEELIDRIKRPVLKLLDEPESPTIRAALNMPPRAASDTQRIDSAIDDWQAPHEHVYIEVVDIDPTPLHTRADQQWVRALLAIAQGYQSVKRFQDADRILKQAYTAAQRFTDPNVQVQLLMNIGELQVAVGSVADAQKTFVSVTPKLSADQKVELVRFLIIGRLLDEAFNVISSIESPEIRENVCSFLLQEQIRINRLEDAEKTLALMPQRNTTTAECRSRLNVAKETATREDFNRLGLTLPDGNSADWERYCADLIQQGFLHLANQAVEGIGDVQNRIKIQARIAREFLLLYQAFNGTNDPNRLTRRELQQEIASAASRTENPIVQTTIMVELLTHLTRHMQTEADRLDGKQLWIQAIDSCRKIVNSDNAAVLFVQLIIAKNMLDNPNLQRRTMPIFTRETNGAAFDETNKLIDEGLDLINSQKYVEQQGKACAHLAMVLVQIGRTTSAQKILDRTLEIAENVSDYQELISMLLATIPALKAMNVTGTIPRIYRLAIDAISHEFSRRHSNVDVYDWRMRDSEIELIVRSQIENGFVDDAVESANRLNEPVLRERLLRTAAYIYLDQGNIDRAELIVRRLTVKEIQNGVLQHVQAFKRRSLSQER